VTLPYYATVGSPYGELAVLWEEWNGGIRVVRVLLPCGNTATSDRVQQYAPGARQGCHADIRCLTEQMSAFFAGQPVRFALDNVALDTCSIFQTRVLLAEHAIPRGQVSTYGLIARHLAVPGAPRAVGAALAHNPFPIIIPCHRAVRSDGGLGGYQGGLTMKRRLLEMEGVQFSPLGRVITSSYHYAT
jgi:methylated-DNA-[protein]-cysteine S-methyltransferase